MRRSYAVGRLIQFVVVLWGAATLNFLIPRMAPGDPIRTRLLMMSRNGSVSQQSIEEMVKAYDQQFGLDQPLPIQYVRYLWDAAHLEFGYSMSQYPAKALTLISAALPWTIGLLLVATVVAFSLGTMLGALMAWPKAPRAFNYLVAPLLTLSSVPYYLLGLILVYLFSIEQRLFPLSGGYTTGTVPSLSLAFVLDVVHHALLPALSIVLAAVGFWALGMRGMMVNTEGEDYMIMAEAKGLPDRLIFFRYALRNAILPQFTSLAIALGAVVSGSVLVEVVFGLPGIGTLLYKSITGSDFFVIYGIVFVIIFAIALATLVIDLVYPLLDPRISYRNT
ncbi:MAG TPA: ABC transporter permease [Chloroflexota bacterium]|nr:ABC transporter permease [Chloroflexota bacterium]